MPSRPAVLIASTLLLAAFLAPPAAAQYPQPGRYPQPQPGQYPPSGPYPQDPNGYPNTYPARLPGGVPMGIPIPEIKLPKKKSKDEDGKAADPNSLKISISSVEGTLRKFSAKDLVLESTKSRMLRFRLLAKTQFRDKANQPIRDSLLQPGDHMMIHVSTDDPETALRVILQRAGTANERASAAKAVDEAKIIVPEAEDLTALKGAAVIEEAEPAATTPTPESPSAVPDDPRPVIRRTPQGVPQATTTAPIPETAPADQANGTSKRLPPAAAFDEPDEIILAAREAAATFTEGLPNFLVHQVTTRYQSNTNPANWRAVDVVTLDVTSVGGKEEYKNVQINGRPTKGPIEDTGSWSTGEFVTTLQDILSPYTNATFTRRGEGRIANRAAHRFDFSVEQHNSHWVIVAPDRSKFSPAYAGAIWIDKETKRVLRIEMKARKFPQGFPWNRVDSNLEYGYVTIDGRNFLLPVESEGYGCATGTDNCSKNAISFRNYRKFGSDTKIIFDSTAPPSGK